RFQGLPMVEPADVDRRVLQVGAPAEEVLGGHAAFRRLEARGDVAPELALQRGHYRELRVDVDLLRAGGDGREAEHALAGDRVQGTVDEDRDAVLGGVLEDGAV